MDPIRSPTGEFYDSVQTTQHNVDASVITAKMDANPTTTSIKDRVYPIAMVVILLFLFFSIVYLLIHFFARKDIGNHFHSLPPIWTHSFTQKSVHASGNK